MKLTPGKVALFAFPVAVGFTLCVFVAASRRTHPRESIPAKPINIQPGGEQRAKLIEDFQAAHADTINTRVDRALDKDPTYARSLLQIDEYFIRGLKGLSEDEKVQMWKMIQEAQARARASGAKKQGTR